MNRIDGSIGIIDAVHTVLIEEANSKPYSKGTKAEMNWEYSEATEWLRQVMYEGCEFDIQWDNNNVGWLIIR